MEPTEMNPSSPLILAVDDNQDLLRSVGSLLRKEGYQVSTAANGEEALAFLDAQSPELILLDILMPGMDGYEVCRRIRERPGLEEVPVVFVTVQTGERDKQTAFAVGGSGYIEKPFQIGPFLRTIESFLSPAELPTERVVESSPPQARELVGSFRRFSEWLHGELGLGSPDGAVASAEGSEGLFPGGLYGWGEGVGITGPQMAHRIGEFTGLPFLSRIDADDIELGVLPQRFCHSRLIVPVKGQAGRRGLILSNPFDWELWDALEHTPYKGRELDVLIAAPDTLRRVFEYKGVESAEVPEGPERAAQIPENAPNPASEGVRAQGVSGTHEEARLPSGRPDPGSEHPVAKLAEEILRSAVEARASDLHIEPKEGEALLRARIDGDMHDLEKIPGSVSAMLISRFKAVSGMDIAEKRKPQDGGMAAEIDGRTFKLRLATSSTPFGESLVIRFLEPSAKPKTLQELGMTEGQAKLLKGLANRSHGLILVVGPTGSGKSTTIYSLLTLVDTQTRSLMSVEDPVEYRIPFANQQQVQETAGVTFESLLRSAVRQDPDILFLGEMRDLFSAKASMDFASSGHLTITTMHSSNSTTAIFRLERLGVSRTDMSEALIGVVAQRLMKRLCVECRGVREISPAEREMLAPFTSDIPEKVAYPVGCPVCRGTGYFGRDGLYEILPFDVELAELVREGLPISDIRSYSRSRGDFLIANHAIQKIRELAFPVQTVYESVLVEEGVFVAPKKVVDAVPAALAPSPTASPATVTSPMASEAASLPESRTSILVAEDDADTRALLERYLSNAGYRVVEAHDGVEALLKLGTEAIDLILSDVNMPNLDGLKLIEIVKQHGMEAPVVFLTAEKSPEVELKGVEMGAVDFIRKPIQKEVLLHRIKRILEQPVS